MRTDWSFTGAFGRVIHVFLNPGGVLLLETGFDQGAAVSELFANDGAVSVLSDICGNDRVVVVEKRLNRG